MNERTIEQYPQDIYSQEVIVLERADLCRALQQKIDAMLGGWKAAIAIDKNLKNESARKAKLSELEVLDNDYQELLAQHHEATGMLKMSQLNVELLKAEFSVAKMHYRRQTAIILADHKENI